jgi:predicted 2-oxoglutarate/Fe(II)-dependent dioxygenase YbiX
MIIEIPNAIDPSWIDKIKSSVQPYLQNTQNTALYRDGNTVCISHVPELKEVDRYLHEFFSDIQRKVIAQRYNVNVPSADSGYEFHRYNSGEICHYHADGEFNNNDKECFIRYASVTLHLNTVYHGGELVFPHQNKTVKTEAGKVVVFPPYGMFGHYTTPSDEVRDVIVTWFVYDGIKAVRNR